MLVCFGVLMFLILFVLYRHIIFFSYKLMTHIIRTKLPYFNSIIIIFRIKKKSLKMTKLGRNVTNKYCRV